MANSITIGSNTYTDTSTFHKLAGNFLAYPPLGSGPIDHGPEYDMLVVHFVGEDTSYTKNLGFLGRDLEIPIAHIAATHDACYAAKASFIGQFTGSNPRTTITWLNSVSFADCILKRNGASDSKIQPLSGLCCLVTTYSFRNLTL